MRGNSDAVDCYALIHSQKYCRLLCAYTQPKILQTAMRLYTAKDAVGFYAYLKTKSGNHRIMV